MLFYLGVDAAWLARLPVRTCVSDRRLRRYRREYPRAASPWMLDSGGFSELEARGTWDAAGSAADYARRAERYVRECGRLDAAAIRDYMCEPHVLRKTGLDVPEHQRRTVDSLLELRTLAADVPWFPVLQGAELDDYLRCVEAYDRAGIDLTREPVVGLGSVCRRESTREIEEIVGALHALGVGGLHGFGVKTDGLRRYGARLGSADSFAWPLVAKKRSLLLPGCAHPGGDCRNCPRWALEWRRRVLAGLPEELADQGVA